MGLRVQGLGFTFLRRSSLGDPKQGTEEYSRSIMGRYTCQGPSALVYSYSILGACSSGPPVKSFHGFPCSPLILAPLGSHHGDVTETRTAKPETRKLLKLSIQDPSMRFCPRTNTICKPERGPTKRTVQPFKKRLTPAYKSTYLHS